MTSHTDNAYTDTRKTSNNGVLIVGVGASAGGLEAFQEIFSSLPKRHEFVMVLVQHLDPENESLLQGLLEKRTESAVITIEDGMHAEPGAIYLLPPGVALTFESQQFILTPFEKPRGLRRPIDRFFQSLAQSAGKDAVAIILSGTGSDGALGARAVKQAGGLVIAQQPAQAKYDGMPKSAIDTGAVDLVLSVSDIVSALSDYSTRRTGLEPALMTDSDFIGRIFRQVQFHTGHDFSQYKKATLSRRLAIRMSVLGCTTLQAYLKEIANNKHEAQQLFRDVLINVTSFFRDKNAFEALKTNIFPDLFERSSSGDEVRIWSAGCSTGEELYTLAMLAYDHIECVNSNASVTIIGTDIDDAALETARRGVYPSTIAEQLPKQFLEKYFIPRPEGFEVSNSLRECVRITEHSLIRDPPFANLDLLVCRNMTIYFEKALQERVGQIFSYAVRTGGYLMMGQSEHLAAEPTYFREIDSRNRIYQRTDKIAKTPNLNKIANAIITKTLESESPTSSVHDATHEKLARALLEDHCPPHLLTDAELNLLYASPGAEELLAVKAGAVALDLRKLIKPQLESALRKLARKALDRNGPEQDTAQGRIFYHDTESFRISSQQLEDDHVLFVFRQSAQAASTRPAPANFVDTSGDEYLRSLERDLDNARETIRLTVNELETSNEELKSSNEEMMSMNEELQSANEELSASNDELQNKILELRIANADLEDSISSTSLPTVFLDNELKVRRFTPESLNFFRFIPSDIGRRLEDIASNLDIDVLLEACSRVRSNGEIEEVELEADGGMSSLFARIVPSLEFDQYNSGVVFTLTDVTEIKLRAQELEEAREIAQQNLAEIEELYRVSPIGIALVGKDLKYIRVNETLAQINGVTVEEHIAKRLDEIVPDLEGEASQIVRKVFETGESILRQEIVGRTPAFPDEDRVWICDWYPLKRGETVTAVGINIRDITAFKEVQAELHRVMRELQHRVKNMLSNVNALISRAKRDERDPKQVLEILSQRILALSNTHKLLTAENWKSTRIADIAKPELIDVYGEKKILLRGPDIGLNARATLSLSMAIHELATNAAKYGSLSIADGGVDLRWLRIDEGDGDKLRIEWKEWGGPSLSGPAESGFGTKLIESTISSSLDGAVQQYWEEDGLRYVFEIPYARATGSEYDIENQVF